MEPNVVNGIFTLAGVVIGGIISYFTTQDKKEINALNRQIKELQNTNEILKKDIVKLCNQVSSYWNIEKAYSEEVASILDKKPKYILEKRRDSIENKGYERPTMTEKGVHDILEKL